jgi:hypothetical protein
MALAMSLLSATNVPLARIPQTATQRQTCLADMLMMMSVTKVQKRNTAFQAQISTTAVMQSGR